MRCATTGVGTSLWLGSEVFPVLDGYANQRIGAPDFICPSMTQAHQETQVFSTGATLYPGVGWNHFYNYLGGYPLVPPQPLGWPRVVTAWTPPMRISDTDSTTALITDNTISSQTFGSSAMHTPRGASYSALADRTHPAQMGAQVQIVGYADTHARAVPIGLTNEYNVVWNAVGITTFW
jgi:hypothetical protein